KSAAPSTSSMALDDIPLQRIEDAPSDDADPALEPAAKPKMWGAVEVNNAPPPNAPPPQRVPPRERPDGDRDYRDDRDDDWDRRPRRRRRYRDDDDDADRSPRGRWRGDGQPPRGGLILTLGIMSLCFAAIFAPLGLLTGILAWVMGAGDLKKIRRGEMDPEGQSQTSGGHICGILGTVGSLLLLALFGMIFLTIWTAVDNSYSPRPPPPTVRPIPQPAPPPGQK